MKKCLVALSALAMSLSLVACGSSQVTESTTTEIDEQVVETTITAENSNVSDAVDTANEETDASATTATDVRPEIKNTLDSYEKFFDEYCTFMQEYQKNPTDTALLTKYSKFMKQYSETMSKLTSMSNEKMSSAETAYLLEVSNRIQQKLAKVVGSN